MPKIMIATPVKTLLIVTIALFFFSNNVFCQDKETTPVSRNALYADLVFSNRIIYSVNYDRIFHHGNKLTYSYRVGFCVVDAGLVLPVGVNVFTGKKSSHVEFSLTVIPYVDHDRTFLAKNDLSDKYIYVVPAIGYRYQKWSGGFFFKAALSPSIFLDPPSDDFWNMDPKLHPAANIAVGYSF